MKFVKVNIIFHSIYGHIYQLALAEAEGAKEVEGVEVGIYQVEEFLPPNIIEAMHATQAKKAFAHIPVATLDTLAESHGIIFGTPTRFGMMSAQMKEFLDSTGPLFSKGALAGKVGSVFTSSQTQHGGQESTILNFHTVLLHHGMVIVGVPYTIPELGYVDGVSGGSPYGASTITGSDRKISDVELKIARAQGRRVAEITKKLFG
ncbi:NAD(P)H:quinone oxidoreductase [Athalassotoga saccharophila]|uniref:NAD(P)H:quinone oxidoreductase n=1 Tax=Athalassotoga saccharophila TaxID=1441386 RepID=UPI00137ACCA1|nr:NAD(P)H:quinone oxidoreductase [Athalassotoga saccharophila]BBJ28310.1 NAD(P)H dehydrogenase (quinone), Type IV [Athalassotoga saccharophila]